MQTEYSAEDIAAASSLQFLVYLCVSMATFWTYDYACSLHEEWTFLLQSRWTKVKYLYIIARNAPFLIIATDLYRYFTPNENHDKCLMLTNIYSCFTFISVVCSECIFVFRTYVLWNNNRFVLAAMLCTSLSFLVASIGITFTTIAASHVTTSAIPGITGCYRGTSHSAQLSMPFLFLFAFELGLVSLTLIRAIQSWRIVSGPLYAVLVKHNIFYYSCGLSLAAANIIMSILFSQYAYHAIFEDFQFFVLAILATRMHLYLWHIDQHIHGFDALMLIPLSTLPADRTA